MIFTSFSCQFWFFLRRTSLPKKHIYHRSFFLFLFQHLLADQNNFKQSQNSISIKMFQQLLKLFFALAFFAFVSSQITEGKKIECYLDNHNLTRVCANRQNLCVRASKCRQIKDDPSHFRGECAWNEMQAINFCVDYLKGSECQSCKICNTSKCNDDEQFMKEIGLDDENNKTKLSTSTELSSTESTPSGAISAFGNGPKWESFIPVAILTASALLLTAAIF